MNGALYAEPVRTLTVLALSVALVAVTATFPASAALPEDYSLTGSMPASKLELAPGPVFDPEGVDEVVPVIEGAAFRVSNHFASLGFDSIQLLDLLDYEAEQAFAFVRERVRFEPYRGVLRGAEGALGARAGNAWDRSLLLKRLLEDMGFDVRLVAGTLDDQARRRLTENALSAGRAGEDLSPLSALVGLSPELRERMTSRARRDYAWLSGGIAEVSSPAGVRSASVSARHVWVQVKLDGEWMDMDSSFPDAETGQAFAQAESFMSEAPQAEVQFVKVSVIAETLSRGSLNEQTLLTQAFEAPGLPERRLFLSFAPRNRTMGGVLTEALGTELQYVPLLSVDGEVTDGDYVPGVRGETSEGEEFFYGNKQSQLTALYLEVSTVSPVGESSAARRILIDRLSDSARAADRIEHSEVEPLEIHDGAPVAFQGVHQLVISNGGSNPHHVARRVGLGLYFLRKHLLGADDLDKLPVDSIMWPIAKVREGQMTINENLLLQAVNDMPGLRFFIGTPRVYVFSHTVETVDDRVRIGETIDLLHDPLSAIWSREIAARDVFERRVWHGVVQSSFETTLSELPAIPQPDNFGKLISSSEDVSGEPLTITAADDPRLPPTLPAALSVQLRGPNLVILSEASLSEGARTWWSVEPDGTTRAMLAPDLGGSYRWWDPLTNSRLPKRSPVNPRVYDIPSMKAHNQYAAAAKERQAQIARSKNLPKTAGSCRSGGTEYLTTQCAATFIVVPGGAAIALTVVAGAFVGVLYMIGYVAISEYQQGRL